MSKTARALRRRSTEAEKLLWSRLRGRRPEGIKFKRQVPIANYIVDFVALDLKFIVEVDGGQHQIRAAADAERTRILQEWGYHVVRLWNNDVLGNIDGVLEAICKSFNSSAEPLTPPSPRRGEGDDWAQKKGAPLARPWARVAGAGARPRASGV